MTTWHPYQPRWTPQRSATTPSRITVKLHFRNEVPLTDSWRLSDPDAQPAKLYYGRQTSSDHNPRSLLSCSSTAHGLQHIAVDLAHMAQLHKGRYQSQLRYILQLEKHPEHYWSEP